jgi:hypothetical protein
MIEESFVRINFAGKDGFFWWIGQVAHEKVWKDKARIDNPGNLTGDAQPFRCKVRIIGYHTFDGGILPDKDLPWAQVMIDPAFGAGNGSVGATVNITGGETCFGFFLDGEDGQSPVIVGLLYRSDGVRNIIDDKTILEKEKSSRFRPFSGHPNKIITSTQREARIEKPYTEDETPPASNSYLQRVENLGISSSTVNFDIATGFFSSGVGSTAFSGESISGIGFTDLFNINIGAGFTDLGRTKLDNPGAYEGIVGGLNPVQSFYAIEAYASRVPAFVKPSICNNNYISRIAGILQDFIAFTNSLDRYKSVYIDATLNAFVDITNEIKNTASQIVGVFRLIVNAIRSSIFKCITWAFRKLLAPIVPLSQQTVVLEAMKKIFDKIFCVLDKLYPGLISSLQDYLLGLVEPLNAPLCAIEQWIGGVLAELMANIEDALAPILSGIEWLTDQYTSVTNYISQASSLASQIYSFLECTGYVCERPSSWSPIYGPSMKMEDDWNKTLSNVNVFRGLQTELGTFSNALTQSSLYNTNNPLFASCNNISNNPTQDDLVNLPIGVKYSQCIPPIVEIIGDGSGAEAVPIVSSSGKIVSIEITKIGLGYTRPPRINIIDRTNYGKGAQAKSTVNLSGQLEAIYILSSGNGYCRGNYSEIFGDFDIQITSNKNSITEGEPVEITVSTFNVINGTEFEYRIEGIPTEMILEPTSGTLTIQNNEAKIKINSNPKILPQGESSKVMRFTLTEYSKFRDIIIKKAVEEIPDELEEGKEYYKLTSNRDRIQEGQSFIIKLETGNIKNGTKIPYRFTNISEDLITPTLMVGELEIFEGGAELTVKTNLDVITQNRLISFNLPIQGLSLNVLVEDIKNIDIPEEKICINKIIVDRPGYGYTQNDRVVIAGKEFKLDLTPKSGAIIGVIQDAPFCDYFEDIPEISINTTTGTGAEVFASTQLSDEFKSQAGAALASRTSLNVTLSGDDEIRETGVLKVIDCV